jgi:alpha-mannosidase
VIATALKPSDDGKALILRLFAVSGKSEKAQLTWSEKPRQIWLSDASERPLRQTGSSIRIPAWGLMTVRLE